MMTKATILAILHCANVPATFSDRSGIKGDSSGRNNMSKRSRLSTIGFLIASSALAGCRDAPVEPKYRMNGDNPFDSAIMESGGAVAALARVSHAKLRRILAAEPVGPIAKKLEAFGSSCVNDRNAVQCRYARAQRIPTNYPIFTAPSYVEMHYAFRVTVSGGTPANRSVEVCVATRSARPGAAIVISVPNAIAHGSLNEACEKGSY